MNHARTTALGLAALALGACSYPDFHYTSESAGSSSSSSVGGGMPGSSSNSAASSGAGGAPVLPCLTMPPGGGDCEYMPGKECGCPANQKCTIDDPMSGHTTCITHANSMPWSKCADDHDCNKGFWCDIWTYKVCRPICSDVSQCPKDAQCLPTSSHPTNFTPIPGLKVCTAHCNPETTDPCSFGVTCVYDDHDLDLQCVTSMNYALDAICTDIADCTKGLVCVAGFPPRCKQWCHEANGMPNGSCPLNAPNCTGVAVSVKYNTSTYGICSP